MDNTAMGNSSSSYNLHKGSSRKQIEDEHPYYDSIRDLCDLQSIYPAKSATEILQYLYLGNCDDAYDKNFLKTAKISHVINCVEGDIVTSHEFYKDLGIKYLGFCAQDDDDYNIMDHFKIVYDFIEKARKSDGAVLIHCIAGVNRSGALAVAYYMAHEKIGPIAATRQIKAKRHRLLTNETFQVQLIHLAHEMNLLHLDKNEIRSSIRRKNQS